VLLTLPIFVEVGWRGASLRLRAEHGGTDEGADFSWTAGGLDLCPATWTLGRAHLTACARARGGVLAASGLHVLPSRGETRPWFDAGPLLRARIDAVGPFFLELEGGLAFVVTRDRFFVEPDVTIHRAPTALGVGAAGAGVSFP
jgi:hypothetical protein